MKQREGTHRGPRVEAKYERTSLMFTLSAQMKEALEQFSGHSQVSRAMVIRVAIARYIKYDLEGEPKATRQRKYANAAERKLAQRARDKAKRALVRKLQDAIARGEREEAIKYIEASLERSEPK